jgi:peptide/nickel transport system substrate-binding protein
MPDRAQLHLDGGENVTVTGRKWARLGALVVVTALVVTACSSSSKKASSGGDTSSGKALTDGVLKVGYDLIQEGGVKVFGDPAAPDNNAGANDSLYYLVFGRFMKQNDDGTLTPDLAKSATIVDPKTVEIVLRDGLKFSDGTALDAAAAKASLERNLATKNQVPFRPSFFALKSIDVVNPTTLKLSFPDGTGPGWFDTYIASWQVSLDKSGDTNADAPIGAGPMAVERYERGQKLILKKNPNYWNASNVKLGGMEFTHVSAAQPAAGMSALRSGQIDVVTTDPSQLSALSGKLTSFKRVSPTQNVWMLICKRDGPLANAKVRVALNKAIDRETLNKAVFGGTSAPSTQLWPKGHKFSDPALDDYLAYDVAGAKKLLKEAGYEKGFSVDIYPVEFVGITQTMEVLKQEFAAIGVTLNIKSGGNFVNDFLVPNVPGLGIFPGDSKGVEKLDDFTGTSLGNVCDYNDPTIASIRSELTKVSESDPKAVELWHQADKVVVEQALDGFLLFRALLSGYNSSRVGGMSSLFLGQFITPDPLKTFVKG